MQGETDIAEQVDCGISRPPQASTTGVLLCCHPQKIEMKSIAHRIHRYRRFEACSQCNSTQARNYLDTVGETQPDRREMLG